MDKKNLKILNTIELMRRCYEDRNDVKAANFLGTCYYYGSCSDWTPDYAQALDWFRRTGEREDPYSLYMLGLMWMKGQGVEKDEEQGLNLIRAAAERGSRTAKKHLESMR